jgi:hypothetical protein
MGKFQKAMTFWKYGSTGQKNALTILEGNGGCFWE